MMSPSDSAPVRGEQKRELIIRAYMKCVLELGLERASMGEVAARVGLDRSSIHYYFSTRDRLLSEAAKLIASTYVDRYNQIISNFSAQDRARQLVEHMFSTDMHQPELSQLIDELALEGDRNKGMNRLVAGIYRTIERVLIVEIDGSYPLAPASRRREVAYVLSQLSEGCSVFTSLGFGTDRLRAARGVALRLLDSLKENSKLIPIAVPRRRKAA